jgi:endogenous inhibitor of DNA gyrase (YacG/DUF329 family)
MCTVDCPFCDHAVAFEPGDDELDCPECGVVVAVMDEGPVRLAAAA